jgi:hypothetical protein
MGMPATGRSVDVQLIDIMRFDEDGLVAELGESSTCCDDAATRRGWCKHSGLGSPEPS